MYILLAAYANLYVANTVYQPLLYSIRDYLTNPTEESINLYIGCFLSLGGATQSISTCPIFAIIIIIIPSDLVWGRLSDQYGRKPVLLVNTCTLTLATLCMGFGRSFAWTLVLHVLCRAGCGSASVIVGALGELAGTDNNNKGIGNMLGPMLGGLLARMELDAFGFSAHHPYLLAFGTAALLSGLVFTAILLSFEETLTHKHHHAATGSLEQGEEGDAVHASSPCSSNSSSSRRARHTVKTLWRAIPRSCWIAIGIYFGAQFIVSISTALKISWGMSPTHKGGLALSPLQFVIAIAFSGASVVLFQLFAYVPLQYLLGSLELYRKSILAMALLFFLLPAMSTLFGDRTCQMSLCGTFWISLLAMFGTRSVTTSIALTTAQMMVRTHY
ncbi:major facilitator superfamily domain-containing protein [Syncephalis pseudoplumigaleata]|uniref:Major facilitator superfamily domain-containing protein n=1 Tax=Syncephalis pseudoplumigaleata TaxID=1712513 RepID=A0A4P9Z3J5_9FUNG|nr:major facilitator superfamily domain-containing protein [Syncephalis pseudoplumigaleata]|eukprot:RKP27127.1 major facilitator superfamily domain-containing protein [Syncephalis pseudoplumigaleata]